MTFQYIIWFAVYCLTILFGFGVLCGADKHGKFEFTEAKASLLVIWPVWLFFVVIYKLGYMFGKLCVEVRKEQSGEV